MPRAFRKVSFREAVIAALLVLGIVWFSYLVWGIFQKEERARREVNDTKAELMALSEQKTKLESDLAELDTERGKEAIEREILGVAKPGEEVIIVVPPTATSSATTTESWWERLFGWF